ncbi:MAG: mannonate dehydratase [Lachnospiraceae bacterium]
MENKKVLCVHFRNVSNTIPRFEETLLEDGYMDMYKVMKEFVKADYDGVLHADHVPLCGARESARVDQRPHGHTAWVTSRHFGNVQWQR